MHRLLKLQHHRHSGKLLPHHHTSYRTLGLLLLLLGIFMVFIQQSAGADSLYVRAKISAPLPVAPAVITNPDDGHITNANTLTISGTCPIATPQNIVVVQEGTTVLGSAPCGTNGTFAVPVMLRSGQQTIIAQIFNITDDPGPIVLGITVTYNPKSPIDPITPVTPNPATPAQRPTTAQPTTPAAQTATGIYIYSKHSFYAYGLNAPVTWEGSFSGGTPPYTVAVDWGDATHSTYPNITPADTAAFIHTYRTIDAYIITLKVTDSAGKTATQSYAAATPYVPYNQVPTTPGSGITSLVQSHDSNTPTTIGIYTAYTLMVTTVGLLWFDARHLGMFTPAPQHAPVQRRSYKRPATTSRSTAKSRKRTRQTK